MSFKQQSDISKEWALCMCSIAQCNVTCDQQTIQDIIDSALFNPGNAPGFLNNDGNGVLSWVPLESTIDYFFTNTASDIATYKQLLTSTVSVQSTITTASVTDTQVLQNWATNANVPNTLTIPSGLYVVNIHAAQTVGTKITQVYADIVECNSTGTDIAIIGTTGFSTVLTGSNADLFVTVNLSSAYVMASLTSRIVVRVRAHVTGGGSAPTVVLYYGGVTDSHLTIPSTTSFGGITQPANGGTGLDTSGSTGIPYVSSGVWSIQGTQSIGDNSNKPASTAYVQANMSDYWIPLSQALGSPIIAETYPYIQINAQAGMANQEVDFWGIWVPTAKTLTGVKWYQSVLGSYTANNNNRIGLYSYSAGTMTLVASCANDGTLWKTAASNTYGLKAFSSTYNAAAGIYFIATLYSNSAQTTQPQLGGMTANLNAAVTALDFTNSARLTGFISGATDLPATQTMAGLGGGLPNYRWFELY